VHVVSAGANVILSWHTNAGGLILQSSSTIPGTWSTVSALRVTNGETVSVTLPRSAARRFYRLLN
jgi:hypothetical protein